MSEQLVLHAIIFHKSSSSPYNTVAKALAESHRMFPELKTKKFVRETEQSFRVRAKPKQQFKQTSFITKVVNPNISLVFGHAK